MCPGYCRADMQEPQQSGLTEDLDEVLGGLAELGGINARLINLDILKGLRRQLCAGVA